MEGRRWGGVRWGMFGWNGVWRRGEGWEEGLEEGGEEDEGEEGGEMDNRGRNSRKNKRKDEVLLPSSSFPLTPHPLDSICHPFPAASGCPFFPGSLLKPRPLPARVPLFPSRLTRRWAELP